MADPIVRTIRPNDLVALLDINAASVPGVTLLAPEEIAGLASGQVRCWVAEVEGSVCGYLIAYHTDTDEVYDGEEFVWFQRHYPSSLYVDQIAVASATQRAGIGSLLYRAARDFATQRGCVALVCEVNREPPNPGSLAFHSRMGFREVGGMRTSDGRAVVLLRLPLAARAPSTEMRDDSSQR